MADKGKIIDLAERHREKMWRVLEEMEFGPDPGLSVLLMAELMNMRQKIEVLPPDQRTPEMLKEYEEALEAYLKL